MTDPGYRRTDVLVVGAGIAGCLAAIEAARAGARTAMVLKGGPPRAAGNTAVAGGGFAVALAHNAFPEAIVFAPRAGAAAARHTRMHPPGATHRTSVSAGLQRTASPELRRALQHLMLRAAGPVRTAAGLADALTALRELRGSAAGDPAEDPGGQLEALATQNLLDVAELVLVSALRREETRGSHFREDRPTRDDGRWLVNQVIDRAGEGPRLVEAPVELVHLVPERPEKGVKE